MFVNYKYILFFTIEVSALGVASCLRRLESARGGVGLVIMALLLKILLCVAINAILIDITLIYHCCSSSFCKMPPLVFCLFSYLRSVDATPSSALLLTLSQMMTLVLVGLVIFDLLLESFEHYLHHHKGRFHQRLLKKVRLPLLKGACSSERYCSGS